MGCSNFNTCDHRKSVLLYVSLTVGTLDTYSNTYSITAECSGNGNLFVYTLVTESYFRQR